MRLHHIFAIAALAASPALAQPTTGSPLIDYDGYSELTAEVAPVRRARLVSLSEFNTRAAKRDVLVLDARSAKAFAEGHINGAVNLPLPDFTAEALAEVIGTNPEREILIYCNNNFTNNRRPVVTKSVQLALNIQTFINLYGYGYRNIYELGEAIDMDAPEVGWVSAAT
jgi:phage shock protein E